MRPPLFSTEPAARDDVRTLSSLNQLQLGADCNADGRACLLNEAVVGDMGAFLTEEVSEWESLF